MITVAIYVNEPLTLGLNDNCVNTTAIFADLSDFAFTELFLQSGLLKQK